LVRQPGQVLTVAEAVLLVAATSVVVTLAVILAVLTRRQRSPVAVHVLAADFAQPRRGSGMPNLPVEVSADQPVRSDTTTEAAAHLLLGRTNSADRETNRRNRMPAGTQPLLASRIDRHH
jgi:hypothetical protein